MLFGRGDHRPIPPHPAPAAEKLSIPGKKGSGVFNRPRRRTSAARRHYSNEPEYSPYPRRLSESGRPSTTVLTPSQVSQQPPPLAEEYPRTEQPSESGWGQSMGMLLPVATPGNRTHRTHKIVDGDTLAALAGRYFGTSQRAGEIYEANRDVLFDPQLLPIDVELKIPPK